MRDRTILALRVVLAGVVAGALFAQLVMIPMVAINSREFGGTQDIAIAAIFFLAMLSLELAAYCFWRLLAMTEAGTVFSQDAYSYVDLLTADAIFACALALALGVVLAPGDDVPPGMILLLGGVALIAAGMALLVRVLRTLLGRAVDLQSEASSLRSELEEVI